MSSEAISSLPFVPPTPAYTYPEFRDLVSQLAAEHRTSGPDQHPLLIRLTDQNQQHLDHSYAAPLLPELVEKLRQLPQPEAWLVLGEAWCGDTAHALATLASLADHSAGRVTLHVVLRSDHPALMETHQTNGKNSIPKLIRYDAATSRELGTWGPRPAEANELSHRLHADTSLHTMTIVKEMNAWYTADHGQCMQRELLALL